MHIPCLICLLSIFFNLFAEEGKYPLPPEIEVHKEQLEKRALEQAMQIIHPPDTCPCLHFTGKKLIACLAYAEKKDVRATFARMSLQGRIDYLLKMDLFDYNFFLDAFENEQQWLDTLVTLSPEEQKLLPKTVLEQRIMIRDTWISCAPREVGHYARGSKDPHAKDIAKWRNKTLEGYERMKKNCPVLLKWLNERFTEQKLKLLLEQKKQT